MDPDANLREQLEPARVLSDEDMARELGRAAPDLLAALDGILPRVKVLSVSFTWPEFDAAVAIRQARGTGEAALAGAPHADAPARLAELVLALDELLQRTGALPARWRVPKRGSRRCEYVRTFDQRRARTLGGHSRIADGRDVL